MRRTYAPSAASTADRRQRGLLLHTGTALEWLSPDVLAPPLGAGSAESV
ncbi:MAG: hypothetical protein M3495_20945 [Pseudomonadota bacterium]|nr:hypothetical protein [Gammaproteobacteria bacterium]MDQ3583907.1 hypothetical protein [Pseudomonadota bacterium]